MEQGPGGGDRAVRGLRGRPGAAAAGLGCACGAAATGDAPVVRDYIAGMTDTYALAEYGRVFHTKITAVKILGGDSRGAGC